MENRSIELTYGWVDSQGETHKLVEFGRRLNGASLFLIDEDPQGKLPTMYNDLIIRWSITKFGTLACPVPLKVLLELDSIDRDDLGDAYNTFSRSAGKTPIVIDDKTVRLAYGYEKNGLVYDMVEFGGRLTGMDEVEADKLGYKSGMIKRVCFLAGLQVKRLYQSDGKVEMAGPIGLEVFEEMDAIDIQAVRIAAEVYRNSFRRVRRSVSSERRSENGSDSGGGNGMERGPDSQSTN